MESSSYSEGAISMSFCLKPSILMPSLALTITVGRLASISGRSDLWAAGSGGAVTVSSLFIVSRTGIFFSSRYPIHSISSEKSFWPATTVMTARSVFEMTSLVFSTLMSPRSPSSSKPAVSMSTQGPRGCISIGLYTGSVVVPATSLTSAVF